MIDKLSDEEKSVLLARAIGWDVYGHEMTIGGYRFRPPGDIDRFISNLYHPENMSLSWLAHLWMWDQEIVGAPYRGYWMHPTATPTNKPDAQRLLLDFILQLLLHPMAYEPEPENGTIY